MIMLSIIENDATMMRSDNIWFQNIRLDNACHFSGLLLSSGTFLTIFSVRIKVGIFTTKSTVHSMWG